MRMFCKSTERKLHLATCCYPICAITEVNPGIQRWARFSSSYLAKCLFAKFTGKFKLHIDGGGGIKEIFCFLQRIFPWPRVFIRNLLLVKYFNSILLYKWVDKCPMDLRYVNCHQVNNLLHMFSKILWCQQWNYWCRVWLRYEKPTKQRNNPKWAAMGSPFCAASDEVLTRASKAEQCEAAGHRSRALIAEVVLGTAFFYPLQLPRFKDIRIQRVAGSIWNPSTSLHKYDCSMHSETAAGQLFSWHLHTVFPSSAAGAQYKKARVYPPSPVS